VRIPHARRTPAAPFCAVSTPSPSSVRLPGSLLHMVEKLGKISQGLGGLRRDPAGLDHLSSLIHARVSSPPKHSFNHAVRPQARRDDHRQHAVTTSRLPGSLLHTHAQAQRAHVLDRASVYIACEEAVGFYRAGHSSLRSGATGRSVGSRVGGGSCVHEIPQSA